VSWPDVDGPWDCRGISDRATRDILSNGFSAYHHSLHSLLFWGCRSGRRPFALATQRWKTTALAFLSFHIHLLEDLLGKVAAQRAINGRFRTSCHFHRGCELTWRGPMDVERLAQFRYHDCAVTDDVLSCLVAGIFLRWRWFRLRPTPLLLRRFGGESRSRDLPSEPRFRLSAWPRLAGAGRMRPPLRELFIPSSFRNCPGCPSNPGKHRLQIPIPQIPRHDFAKPRAGSPSSPLDRAPSYNCDWSKPRPSPINLAALHRGRPGRTLRLAWPWSVPRLPFFSRRCGRIRTSLLRPCLLPGRPSQSRRRQSIAEEISEPRSRSVPGCCLR